MRDLLTCQQARSRTGPGVPTGALAERGESRGACDTEMLLHGVSRIEPYETEQTILLDASEQVGDLRRLSGGRYRAGLRDEYGVAGQCCTSPIVGPNKGANCHDGLR